MERERIVSNLRFIRETMQAATRYTNVPPLGYIVAGALGLAASFRSLALLNGKTSELSLITNQDLGRLGLLWAATLLAAASASAVLSSLHARSHGFPAWNPLAQKILLSQLPQIATGAFITIVLARNQAVHLIPAWWLLCYGLTLFSLHYFTGVEHFIQSAIFILLGTAAAFAPLSASIILLAIGFGAVNLAFGIKGVIVRENPVQTRTPEQGDP